MGAIRKVKSVRWKVVPPDECDEKVRTFKAETDATEYLSQLELAGFAKAKKSQVISIAWEVRIRSRLAPDLCKTFPTRKAADDWVKVKDGEIVSRRFVDYREADNNTLGDLFRKYDATVLADRPNDDPARVRMRCLQQRALASIVMSALQPGDIAAYRDARLQGRLGDPPVKGATVNKELELMGRVIALARREWKLHLAANAASGKLVSRVPAGEGDERDRRLKDVYVPVEACRALKVERMRPHAPDGDKGSANANASASKRRKTADDAFEIDPDTEALLAMPQSEQQALLRALRYPGWFTERKRVVTDATLKARAKKKLQAPLKARVRDKGRHWALVSLAIETAMRRGELLKLRWAHVHLARGYVDLPKEITKNGKGRIVPLSLRAMRILATQPRTGEAVFEASIEACKSAFRRARERIGATDLRRHDLRHEATSRFFEQTDLRANEIGYVTGHTDPRMLERYYNKRPDDFVKRVKQSFNQEGK